MTTLISERVTQADLNWWLKLAPTLEWTFAKTYAKTAPHSYVVNGRTVGMTPEDYIRAGRVIRTFGMPGKFYDFTNIYLPSADGTLKWWTMDARAGNTTLINQATTDVVYGEQNAQSTRSDHWSVYDEIATEYDRIWSPSDGDERAALLNVVAELGLDKPTTLDIGCGTGAVLDLGITTPDRYVGVDPSQAMLNELVMKQGKARVTGIIPRRMEDTIDDLRGQRFELVIAAFGSASYLKADLIRQLPTICSGSLLLMTYRDGYLPEYHDGTQPMLTSDDVVNALGIGSWIDSGRVRRDHVGKFDYISIARTA
jgi:SAM-dependent methyltransferase